MIIAHKYIMCLHKNLHKIMQVFFYVLKDYLDYFIFVHTSCRTNYKHMTTKLNTSYKLACLFSRFSHLLGSWLSQMALFRRLIGCFGGGVSQKGKKVKGVRNEKVPKTFRSRWCSCDSRSSRPSRPSKSTQMRLRLSR